MSILLVDDEPRLRQTLAASLAARGYSVEEAATYAEAMTAINSRDFDLLCLDINLPDATGWDVLRELRDAGRVMPAIVFSALPPAASRIREFNPVGVLTKPFPMEALVRLVRMAGDKAKTDPAGST